MGCVWRGVCRSWGRERLAALKKNKACCGWEEARGGSMRKRRLLTRCARMMVSDNMVDALHEEEAQMDGDAPVAQIHNLVGTSMIESSVTPLRLDVIARLLPSFVYDKAKFAAITVRLSKPFCTCLLFTSGKMVLTGCRSFLECVLASHEIVRLLRRNVVGCRFRLVNCSIQNIVANVDLALKGKMVNLDRIYKEHNLFSTFQRNMFPGLIYRSPNEAVVLLVFQSGKVVITGGKSTKDVVTGWKQLWPFVRDYIEPVDA